MERLIIGLVYSSLVLLAKYLYGVRQLYAVVPKLYKVSELSSNGSISEINIINKGKKVEENITLQLNKNMKCELLASNSSDVTVKDNLITIPRLHAKSDVSLILASDDEEITKDKLISLSSKECKGEIIKSIDEIPPNYFNIAMFTIVVFSLFIILFWYDEIKLYTEKIFNTEQKITKEFNVSVDPDTKSILKLGTTNIKVKKTEKQLLLDKTKVNIQNKGWKNIDKYLASDFSHSYTYQEFPIRHIETKIDGKLAKYKFEIINKTALPLEVTINGMPNISIKEFKNNNWYNHYESVKIATMSKKIVTVDSLRQKNDFVNIQFIIRYGSEYIHGLIQKLQLKPWKKLSDDEITTRLTGKWKFSRTRMYGEVEYNDDGTYVSNVWFDLNKEKKFFIHKGEWHILNTNLYHNSIEQHKMPYSKGMKKNTKVIDITKHRLVLNDEEDNLFMVRYRIKEDMNTTK
jgi:hypothetical protein